MEEVQGDSEESGDAGLKPVRQAAGISDAAAVLSPGRPADSVNS